MASFDELEKQWTARAPLPEAEGTVKLLVVRVGDGKHDIVERVGATVDGGLDGDRWSKGESPDGEQQITMMMATAAQLITGDSESLHLPGDNLIVDLDLHENNLPVGTRVSVGSVVLEITPKLHAGCKKFSARFGQGALRWVNLKDHRPRRLRGVNCKVVEAGEIATGDTIAVLPD